MANIEHKGVVIELLPKSIRVELVVESACASCHLKGACSSSDSSVKVMDVATPDSQKYSIGQSVVVGVEEKRVLGLVLLAYIAPVIITVILLLILVENGIAEGIAGVATLAALALYFLILHTIMRLRNSKLDVKIIENKQ